MEGDVFDDDAVYDDEELFLLTLRVSLPVTAVDNAVLSLVTFKHGVAPLITRRQLESIK